MNKIVVAAAAVAAVVTTAAAQTRVAGTPAERIHARQANYKQMGGALKAINAELKGDAPSIDVIRQSSHLIVTYAPQVLRWFPRGTGAEAGVRTRAKPEIWSDAAGFRRRGAGLLVAARNLDAAARRGDLAAVRVAVPQLAQACSNCHDNYRAPEH